MYFILVDIGNSLIKLAVVDAATCDVNPKDVLCLDSAMVGDSWQEFKTTVAVRKPVKCFVSSVNAKLKKAFCERVRHEIAAIELVLISADDLDTLSNVECRSQLGIDRLLAASAAFQLANENLEDPVPVVIVDAGTAVTIDLVDRSEVFQGGVIFPGIDVSLEALAAATDALPDLAKTISSETFDEAIGRSTESAIIRGVLQSQAYSIQGIVEQISKASNVKPRIVVTGGGIDPIREMLPDHWSYVEHLVLRGIRDVAKRIKVGE